MRVYSRRMKLAMMINYSGDFHADVTRILNTPEMRERLIAQGAEAAPDTPAEFTRFIADELARYARIVKASGAKVD